jgi:hypothetical protein
MTVGGIDVGRTRDRTVLARLEPTNVLSDLYIPRLGPLTEQAALLRPRLADLDLILIDATGVGTGLADILTDIGFPIVAVHLTHGNIWNIGINGISIGTNRLFDLFRFDLPRVAKTCSYRDELRREMGNLKGIFTSCGGVRYAAAAGHDDMVFAVALAKVALALIRSGWKGKHDGKETRSGSSLGQGKYAASIE